MTQTRHLLSPQRVGGESPQPKRAEEKYIQYELVSKEGEHMKFTTAVSMGNMWEAMEARRNRMKRK